MKTYLVGGAVRDKLLGLEPKDHDYVITGATEADVVAMLASGFKQVGKDFPVFLHPETGEEYALARIERKIGEGHHGFSTFTSPELTIRDDLQRRDFTINAMAIDIETGELVDPFGGQMDLEQGRLRAVSEAFAEDPLRVFRAARFVARYGFEISPRTMHFMRALSNSGELNTLSKERVWNELEKILVEPFTKRGLEALRLCGATTVFGEYFHQYEQSITRPDETELFEILNPESKFALIAATTLAAKKKDRDKWFAEMKIPVKFKKAAIMYIEVIDKFKNFGKLSKEEKLGFLKITGLINQHETFDSILGAIEYSCMRSKHDFLLTYERVCKCLAEVKSVDVQAIVDSCVNEHVGVGVQRINQARMDAMTEDF